MKSMWRLVGCGVFAVSLCGCSMKVKDASPTEVSSLTERYDQRDLLTWSDQMAQALMAHPFPPAGEEQPIVVDMGVENRTETHADMKAITDTITTKMMDASKIRLVNASRRDDLLKEQGFQLANCTEETKVAIGRQLGAKYMMTGSLIEISRDEGKGIRLKKSADTYYQLTVEITDLETGLITCRKQLDRLRRASKPVLGW
ncbi:MAG: penicillin-binding protein activator LpoB [Lentisphaerae bacterium]|nr:penicillin-binding protein activator LpoB [Lentisphaerota bacterium]